MVDFDIAPVRSSIIMCMGVGGGGGNAVKHMFRLGIADVTFVICNTDNQALEDSPVPIKIRMGDQLTGGLGAGNKPERGREAAEESIERIKEIFVENDTRMLFVTAGMGGGTGTGAAPVIARAAKEMGILTVAIVSIPFKTEGRKRIQQAIEGIEEIRKHVDSLLVVDNQSINEIYGDLTLSEAFGKADDILATAAKSIADIITSHFKINVDFEDVKTVMRNSGVALMGSAQGSGENRAFEVAQKAMTSPLLHQNDISGAKNILLNITSGRREVTLRETYEITEYIQQSAGTNQSADLIWGAGQDDSLGDDIRVTVIATGFDVDSIPALWDHYRASLPDGGIANGSKVYNTHEPEGPVRQVINLDEQEIDIIPTKDAVDSDFEIVFRDESDRPVDNTGRREQNPITIQLPPRPNQSQTRNSFSSDVTEPIHDTVSETVSDRGTVNDMNSNHNQPFEPVIEVRQRFIDSGDPLTQDMSDEELNVPAWKRRGIVLEAGLSNPGSKVQRETLKTESKAENTSNPNLFE